MNKENAVSSKNSDEIKSKYVSQRIMAKMAGVSQPTIKKLEDMGIISSIRIPGLRRCLYDPVKVLTALEEKQNVKS
ncbi:hypothetical protein [Saccharicrinis sp. FJH54]|uniref:hypothetical protein n=1 Tax=Saccharicrinis sp. FJH54 TaxID=3344665 RepID=UPI0035D486DF